MKVTLCIAIALVAVASAAPFEWPKTRRVGANDCAADNGAAPPTWCAANAAGNTFPCKCEANDDCGAANKYCVSAGAAGATRKLLTVCGDLDADQALAADCACGSTHVTAPATKAATMPAGIGANDVVGFCLLNKVAGGNPTQASTDTCPTAAAANVLNAKATCGDGTLNACEKGKACVGGECLPACAKTDGTADEGADCACGTHGTVVKVAANKVCLVNAATGVGVAKPGLCTDTTGATALTGDADGCSCGPNAALVSNTEYCRVVNNVGYMVAGAKCSTTDGSAKATAACKCGYGVAGNIGNIAAANTKWCVEGTNGKGNVFDAAPGNACAKTDGTADETAACKCGTTTIVPVAANKVCSVNALGVGVEKPGLCTDTAAATALTGDADGCSCGQNLALVSNTEYCRVVNNVGYKVTGKKCSNLAGTAALSEDCACGYGTPAGDIVAHTHAAGTDRFCFEAATGKGYVQVAKQCSAFNANQADGSTAAAQDCACGTAGAAASIAKKGYCAFCWDDASYVGQSDAVVACASTDGSKKYTSTPNKCKCGTEACAVNKYCYTGASAAAATGTCRANPLATCSDLDGDAAVDDDCLCGTAKADKNQYCIASINAVNTIALANCVDTYGRTAVAAGAACKCGAATATGTARSDDICTAGQFCDGSQAGTGNNGANGKCLTTALAAPAAVTTYGVSTITQAVTFGGLSAAQWTGGLKTAGEIGYAKAQGWTTGTGNAIAIATGFTVTSAAARRAMTVTFTSTLQASPAAVTAAKAAVTAATLNTNMASVNTAKSLGATIPAVGTMSVAAATSTTAPAATVSGASTVTTSIMAMAVAVLAAFQARQ